MSDRESSPQMYFRRHREPRSEPWMLEGLKVMRRERRASKINRINLEKEQLLIKKQERREARSRPYLDGASTDAFNDDFRRSPKDSIDGSDEEMSAENVRYVERKQLRESQGPAPKPRMRNPISKDRMQLHASSASKAHLRQMLGSIPRKVTATITRPEQRNAGGESSTLAVAEVTSSTDSVVQIHNSSDENSGDEGNTSKTTDPKMCTSSNITDVVTDRSYSTSSESEGSGSWEDDYVPDFI